MLFNSYIFIFAFFPVFVIGFFLLNRFKTNTAALLFMTVMSLVFYGYNNLRYVPLIVLSITVNYLFSRILTADRLQSRVRIRKTAAAAGVLFNVSLIFYYKYYDFFVFNLNRFFHTDFLLKNLLLPLGISFFTFQQISFIIDSYRNETKEYSFVEYASFISFFPQLVAGPIVYHNEMIPQFRDERIRKPDWDNLSDGLFLFGMGLFKKVLIADTFSKAVSWGYGNLGEAVSVDLIIVMISYTFQIYFDFSGYCDMASGLARMVNIKLPVNFNSPYKAVTIRDFWKRWHMTLTRFLTKYLYIPLGGNRRGTVRTSINMFIVFLVSGIWHGASWTFIAWGILHGILCIIERLGDRWIKKIPSLVKWCLTFVIVNVLWLLFRSDSLGQWSAVLKKILHFDGMGVSEGLKETFYSVEFDPILSVGFLSRLNSGLHGMLPMLVLIVIAFIVCLCVKNNQMRRIHKNIGTAAVFFVLTAWAVISLSGESVFLYFNF